MSLNSMNHDNSIVKTSTIYLDIVMFPAIAPWGKSMQFCFIEEVVQWWSMGKNIFKHK